MKRVLMVDVDGSGDEWERKITYAGVALKLKCPSAVGGQIVGALTRIGGDGIEYLVAGSGVPELPWPPDPTWTVYGERCFCPECGGRLVGATVEEFRSEVNRIDDDPTVNVDTFFLRYLESARDVTVRKARGLRYAIQRDTSTFTDTYLRRGRQVTVSYDGSFQEIIQVTVVRPETGESYPSTLAGALTALAGPAGS
jgi:hypothetical protein